MYNQFPYMYYTPRPMSSTLGNGNLLNFSKKFNWDGFLNNAQRTLNVINQAMPIYNQVKPMFKNMGTIFRVIGELNNTSNVSNSVSQPNTNSSNNTPQFFA